MGHQINDRSGDKKQGYQPQTTLPKTESNKNNKVGAQKMNATETHEVRTRKRIDWFWEILDKAEASAWNGINVIIVNKHTRHMHAEII